jgi:selenide, water dikinase
MYLPTVPPLRVSNSQPHPTSSYQSQLLLTDASPPLKQKQDLVLLGGGHSHVEVIRSFGMRPPPGVRLTLITRDVHTPYSGMIPGYVSGFYTYDDCHIDLARLAHFANARFIHAEARSIDTAARQILLKDPSRPPIDYDVLSINTGITPKASNVPGAQRNTTPVKPIDRFVERLETKIFPNLLKHNSDSSAGRYNIAVVGGGAGGVELALALSRRIAVAAAIGSERINGTATTTLAVPLVTVTLVSRGLVLQNSPAAARRLALENLQKAGIMVHQNAAVVEVTDRNELILRGDDEGGRKLLHFDDCLWCTQANAAGWLKETGLPLSDDGFIAVNDYLQSDGGPAEVFAAGDVATMTNHPRPKAGVYAVRAGPPLAENLRRFVSGQPLKIYTPQSTNLAIISTGNKNAIATKGWFNTQGAYLWTFKDWIDRRFMAKYSTDLNFEDKMNKMMAMNRKAVKYVALLSSDSNSYSTEMHNAAQASQGRCAGCGSKVGAAVLRRVLNKLQQEHYTKHQLDDDAAILSCPPPGHLPIQTIDFFKAMCDDPWTFGAVAANHSLGDCWAMGGVPTSALAVAVVPFMRSSLVERDLSQMMAGALHILSNCDSNNNNNNNNSGCELVGGHTAEGAELSLGFTINGIVKQGQILRKGGLKEGQALIVTKPVGTGVLLAGAMKGVTKGRWLTVATENMLQSSGAASDIFIKYGATGCTDITGFGLLGHLSEMMLATDSNNNNNSTSSCSSELVAEINANLIPVLEGSLHCVKCGVRSSLYNDNSSYAATHCSLTSSSSVVVDHPLWPLLVDPQTAGGLLGGVEMGKAEECVAAMREAGYTEAVVIGKVVKVNDSSSSSGKRILIK